MRVLSEAFHLPCFTIACYKSFYMYVHMYSTRLSWSERSLRIFQNKIKHLTWKHYKTPNATTTFPSICFPHLFSGSCLSSTPSTTKRLLKYWKDLNTSTSSWVMSWGPIKGKTATDGTGEAWQRSVAQCLGDNESRIWLEHAGSGSDCKHKLCSNLWAEKEGFFLVSILPLNVLSSNIFQYLFSLLARH